jgi:hypothetical protein
MGMRQGDRGEGYGIQDPRFGVGTGSAYGHDAGAGGHGAPHHRNRYPDGRTVGSADQMYSQAPSSSSYYSSNGQSHSAPTSFNPSDAARYRQHQLHLQQHQQHHQQHNHFDQQQQLHYQQQQQHRHQQQQQLSTRDASYQLQLAGRSDTAASRNAVGAAQSTHPGSITALQDEEIESDEMRDSEEDDDEDEEGDEHQDQGEAEERRSKSKSDGLQQSKPFPASGESLFRMGTGLGSGQGPGPRTIGVPASIPEASVLVNESSFMGGDFSFM